MPSVRRRQRRVAGAPPAARGAIANEGALAPGGAQPASCLAAA